jgi:hypothetical protein
MHVSSLCPTIYFFLNDPATTADLRAKYVTSADFLKKIQG